jgi:hypothetical protein
MFWYPVYGHPDGPNQNPYFRVQNSFAYATDCNPDPFGDRALPWFAIMGESVFPAEGHCGRESVGPWYTIVGSLLYPTAHHPAGESKNPWYQQRS